MKENGGSSQKTVQLHCYIRLIISSITNHPEQDIDENTSLVMDLFMDSIMFTEMLCNIESELGVLITDDQVQDLYTVGDVYRIVDKIKL